MLALALVLLGCDPQPDHARIAAEIACDDGIALGCADAAEMEARSELSREYARKACELGDDRGCVLWGLHAAGTDDAARALRGVWMGKGEGGA